MVWYGMVWYGMVWYGMVWYGVVWNGMEWYGMVWYGTAWYGMVWYGMVLNGMVWYGMVWYGMVWYGMVWYGMVWYGTAWYGMVRYGTVRYDFRRWILNVRRIRLLSRRCEYFQLHVLSSSYGTLVFDVVLYDGSPKRRSLAPPTPPGSPSAAKVCSLPPSMAVVCPLRPAKGRRVISPPSLPSWGGLLLPPSFSSCRPLTCTCSSRYQTPQLSADPIPVLGPTQPQPPRPDEATPTVSHGGSSSARRHEKSPRTKRGGGRGVARAPPHATTACRAPWSSAHPWQRYEPPVL